MTGRTQRPPVSARDQEIIASRQDGRTLQQVADVYGLSRQRIAQIFRKNGGPVLSDVSRARSQRTSGSGRQVARLIGLDLEEHPGSSEAEVAVRLGIDVADVRANVPQSVRHLLVSDGRTGVAIWTREASLDAVSLASTFEWPLSGTTYDSLLRQGEIRGDRKSVV